MSLQNETFMHVGFVCTGGPSDSEGHLIRFLSIFLCTLLLYDYINNNINSDILRLLAVTQRLKFTKMMIQSWICQIVYISRPEPLSVVQPNMCVCVHEVTTCAVCVSNDTTHTLRWLSSDLSVFLSYWTPASNSFICLHLFALYRVTSPPLQPAIVTCYRPRQLTIMQCNFVTQFVWPYSNP